VNRVVTIAFRVHGPIERQDLPGLCDRICRLLEDSGAAVALCDVHGVAADAVSADALARLQIAARRRGCQIQLRGASEQLWGLIAFMGLTGVFPAAPDAWPGAPGTLPGAPDAWPEAPL
jgi:ABC-type transporter Mla MlaB component